MVDDDTLKRIADAGTREYFAWIRHILTISTGGLTLLVALQSQFVPAHPRWIILLQGTWVLLAASVLFALFGLAGMSAIYLQAGNMLLKSAQAPAQITGARRVLVCIPQPYRTCCKIAPWTFLGAIVLLCIFGVANVDRLQRTPDAAPEETRGTRGEPK